VEREVKATVNRENKGWKIPLLPAAAFGNGESGARRNQSIIAAYFEQEK